MLRILRLRVCDTGSVVPHAPQLDHLPAHRLHLFMQRTISARVSTVEDDFGERTVEWVPMLANLAQVTVDAATAHHYMLGFDQEIALAAAPVAANYGAVAPLQPQHPVLEQPAQPVVLEHLSGQRLCDTASAAPGHVIAGQRVSIPEIAAFHPLHRWEKTDAALP